MHESQFIEKGGEKYYSKSDARTLIIEIPFRTWKYKFHL